jgi:inner membrane transporter RhtA
MPPWLLVAVSILSVQMGAAVAKQLFDEVGFAGVVFLRTFLGGLVFLALIRPRWRGHSPYVYRMVALYGAVISINMLTFYAAIDRIPLGIAVAIAFLGPLSISVAGSRRAVDLVWIGLAVIGILLLSPITDITLDAVGALLAFICAGAWALFIIMTKRTGALLPGNSLLALSMCVAAVVSAPFGAIPSLTILPDPALIALAVVVALLSSVTPFWLEFRALKHIRLPVFGLLMSLEPAVATLIGWVLLGEVLSTEKVIGIALVTIAAAATTRGEY